MACVTFNDQIFCLMWSCVELILTWCDVTQAISTTRVRLQNFEVWHLTGRRKSYLQIINKAFHSNDFYSNKLSSNRNISISDLIACFFYICFREVSVLVLDLCVHFFLLFLLEKHRKLGSFPVSLGQTVRMSRYVGHGGMLQHLRTLDNSH